MYSGHCVRQYYSMEFCNLELELSAYNVRGAFQITTLGGTLRCDWEQTCKCLQCKGVLTNYNIRGDP